jgi:ribosomal protein L29
MKKNEFVEKKNAKAQPSVKSINEKLDALRKELFDLRLSAASTPIKDNSQFKKLRASIARGLTLLRAKSSEEVKIDG